MNISTFYNDPNAEEMIVSATISNQSEFDYIFASLILSEYKVYVSAYQNADNTFCFSPNGSGKIILPQGQEAIIMATAYKDDKPYFCLKKITISSELDISLILKETTSEKLKKKIKRNL